MFRHRLLPPVGGDKSSPKDFPLCAARFQKPKLTLYAPIPNTEYNPTRQGLIAPSPAAAPALMLYYQTYRNTIPPVCLYLPLHTFAIEVSSNPNFLAANDADG